VFKRSGRFIVHHPVIVILIWAAVTIGSAAVAIFGIGGPTIFSQLETDKPAVPDSNSQNAYDVINQSAANSVNLLVEGADLADPAQLAGLAAALAPARADLTALANVTAEADPLQAPPDGWPEGVPYNAQYLATDGHGFVVSVSLAAGLDDAAEKAAAAAAADRLEELGDALDAVTGGSHIVSSTDLVMKQMNEFMEDELLRAEAIALPAAVIVLVVVFGGLLAAAMPAIGAIATIVTGLGGMILINAFMDLDSVIINVITIIGMGLSIDYGLLIVSRCREELHRFGVSPEGGPSRHDPLVLRAVGQVHATAGRTVTFSALTITACVLGLVLMKASLLKGIGVGGAMAVLLAMLTATTFVPAILVLHGRRFVRPSPLRRIPGLSHLIGAVGEVTTDHGFFAKLAHWVQRFRWPVFAVTLAGLAAAATLVGGLQMRSTGLDMLPEDRDQSQYYAALDADYPYLATPDLYVVTPGALDEAAAAGLAATLGGVAHVAAVTGPVDLGAVDGNLLYAVTLDVADAGGPEASDTVRLIRDLPEGLYVAGDAADQLDFKDSLIDGFPLAGTVVVVAVFVLLFLMTGSVVVPLKALITNGLSIVASLGLATWIFTTGHGFATTGIEIYVVAMVVAFGFGLAMDYEVFLLDRIKEIYDVVDDNSKAVARGLQRSGRIITSAAGVIIVVFLGFALGDLAPVRQAGLTLAVLVFLDATVVRMLLVPATMTILGRANWWAPAPLRRFARLFAIRHVEHAGQSAPDN
jgi:RND superfamily putative drug exporter